MGKCLALITYLYLILRCSSVSSILAAGRHLRINICRNLQDGTTPLILASAAGHLQCVVELLEQGADPNVRRSTGTTALFFAAQGGHLEVVKVLLEAGANIEMASQVCTEPLHAYTLVGGCFIMGRFVITPVGRRYRPLCGCAKRQRQNC